MANVSNFVKQQDCGETTNRLQSPCRAHRSVTWMCRFYIITYCQTPADLVLGHRDVGSLSYQRAGTT